MLPGQHLSSVPAHTWQVLFTHVKVFDLHFSLPLQQASSLCPQLLVATKLVSSGVGEGDSSGVVQIPARQTFPELQLVSRSQIIPNVAMDGSGVGLASVIKENIPNATQVQVAVPAP